jgi:hypothetical protein
MRPTKNIGRNVPLAELENNAVLNHQQFGAAPGGGGTFTWTGGTALGDEDKEYIVFLTYLAGQGTLENPDGSFSWAFNGTYDWTHFPPRFDGGFIVKAAAAGSYAWSSFVRQN